MRLADPQALLRLLDQVEIVALPDEDGTAIGGPVQAGADRKAFRTPRPPARK